VGLERGPLRLVSTTEELLGRKSNGSCLENREYGPRDPSRWPRSTFYPHKLAITSPTSGGRSVCIVRSRTQATESSFSLFLLFLTASTCCGLFDHLQAEYSILDFEIITLTTETCSGCKEQYKRRTTEIVAGAGVPGILI
jgi:hypothetical protein